MQRRITARINSAFHFKLGFMIEIDGWNSAANGVDRSAVAEQTATLRPQTKLGGAELQMKNLRQLGHGGVSWHFLLPLLVQLPIAGCESLPDRRFSGSLCRRQCRSLCRKYRYWSQLCRRFSAPPAWPASFSVGAAVAG